MQFVDGLCDSVLLWTGAVMQKPLSLFAACFGAWLLLGGNVQQAINYVAVSTGVTGLGTGIATALGINVGTAGAPVINGGALGTPSSGVATNLTSIPVANATGTLPPANLGGLGVLSNALGGD